MTNMTQKQVVRNFPKCKANELDFVALGSNEALQEFSSYYKHLSRIGVRNANCVLEKGQLYCVANVVGRNKGNACHHLQLKAHELGIILPTHICHIGSSYRYTKNLQHTYKEKRAEVKQRKLQKDTLTKKEVIKRVKKQMRKPVARVKPMSFWQKLVNLFKAPTQY